MPVVSRHSAHIRSFALEMWIGDLKQPIEGVSKEQEEIGPLAKKTLRPQNAQSHHCLAAPLGWSLRRALGCSMSAVIKSLSMQQEGFKHIAAFAMERAVANLTCLDTVQSGRSNKVPPVSAARARKADPWLCANQRVQMEKETTKKQNWVQNRWTKAETKRWLKPSR